MLYRMTLAPLRHAATAVLFVLAAVGSASAAPSPTKPAILLPLEGEGTSPSWKKTPTGDDLQREYPPLALMADLNGSAIITCTVETDGRVTDCHIVSEDPPGFGFGAAAMRTSAYFLMNPSKLDGKAVVGHVTVPVRFRTADDEQVTPEAPFPVVTPAALQTATQIVMLRGQAARAKARWREWLDQATERAAVEGEAGQSQSTVDAFRQALDNAIAWDLDRRAHLMASQMSQSDLDATAAYLKTGAGKAWSAADFSVDSDNSKEMMEHLRRNIHADFAKHLTPKPKS